MEKNQFKTKTEKIEGLGGAKIEIEKIRNEDIIVLRPKGNLQTGMDYDVFRTSIEEILNQGFKKIILDIRHLTFLNSIGVGEFVGAYTSVKKVDGELIFVKPRNSIHNLMKTLFLDKILNIADSVESAITIFKIKEK